MTLAAFATVANDPPARMWLTALMEDAAQLRDDIYGLRLRAEHYHGTHVVFELTEMDYEDSEADATHRLRKVVFTFEGRVSVISVEEYPATVPLFSAKIDG